MATGQDHNGPPEYPAASKRTGEQGRVEIKVLVDTQGIPSKAEISRSSGFRRLDASALEATMRWRYEPGRRNGVAEPMWMLVPINFILEGAKPRPPE
ncbi:MAG: energy transducer TonB [Pseudomonadota bacterium]